MRLDRPASGAPGPDRGSVGRYGEELAARHLLALGYRLLERRWRCQLGELDLVAQAGTTIVAVEVRARHGVAFGTASESITARKAARLRRLLDLYLLGHPHLDHLDRRIDLVAIQLMGTGQAPTIEHIISAVEG